MKNFFLRFDEEPEDENEDGDEDGEGEEVLCNTGFVEKFNLVMTLKVLLLVLLKLFLNKVVLN